MVEVGDLHTAHQPLELLLRQKHLCFLWGAWPLETVVSIKNLGEENPSVAFPADSPDTPCITAAEEE